MKTGSKESVKNSWFNFAKPKNWEDEHRVVIKEILPTTPVMKNDAEIHRAKVVFESEDGSQITKTFLLYDYPDNPLCQMVKAILDVDLEEVNPDMLIGQAVMLTFKKETIKSKEYINVVRVRGVEDCKIDE